MDKNMTLEKRIAAELYSYQGKMSVFVDDLHGHTVEIGADEEFETASRTAVKAMIAQAGPPVLDGQGLMRSGVILRHLALPGAAADTRAVLRFCPATMATA